MAPQPSSRASTLLDDWHASVRACRGLVDDLAEAEDCASAALVSLVADADCVNDPRAFAVSTARRRATDVVRRKKWDRERAQRYVGRATARQELPDERCLDRAEAAWVIEKVWPQLPAQTRTVVELRAAEHSLSDIAEKTGLTVRGVDGHLRRSREAVRRALAPTLSAVGLLWATARRSAPAAPAVVAVAAMGALTFIPATPSTGHAPGAAHPQPATQAHEAPAGKTNEATRTEIAAPDIKDKAWPALSPTALPRAYERDVVVGTQAGPIAPVTVGDTGGNEQGTAEVVAACLEDFQLSAHQIGCSG